MWYNRVVMSKTILFFCDERGDVAMRKHAGICAFGRQKGWNVRFVHYIASTTSFSDYLAIWKPDGIISDNVAFASDSSGIPTVFLDAKDIDHQCPWPGVFHDPRAAARLAAAEFARLGHRNLAYLPPAAECEWSDGRQDAFRLCARTFAQSISVFPKKRTETLTPAYLRRLQDWARALPKPCGVFAANDETASLFLSCCPVVGVKVPQELTVIGVDDIAEICENAFPPLTSVAPAFKESGTMAAELLDALMAGRKVAAHALLFGAVGLTRRESSRRFVGHATALRNARDLILRESCRGLRARDVFVQMKGSRRNAQLQFKAATGRTVLEEITTLRLRQAKRLLQTTSLTLSEIAARCGYKSSSHLRKVFAQRMKTTMGAWRTAHRKMRILRDLPSPQPNQI